MDNLIISIEPGDSLKLLLYEFKVSYKLKNPFSHLNIQMRKWIFR